MSLSDTYYREDVERIPREPTRLLPPGSGPGEEYETEVDDTSESSSTESEVEHAAEEESQGSDDNGNQSGD